MFTPRTLFAYRQQIIDKLSAVLPEDAARLTKEEGLLHGSSGEDIPPSPKENTATRPTKLSLPLHSKALAKQWLSRAKAVMEARKAMVALLGLLCEKHCVSCKGKYGLRAEMIESYDEMMALFNAS